MFYTTILDVAVGLVLVFLSVSLIASCVTEALATMTGLRARTLHDGVGSLLNDPGFASVAGELYSHALVNPLSDGTAKPTVLPAYIDPASFAAALMEVTKIAGATPHAVSAAIAQLPDRQIRQLLRGMFDRADGDLGGMRAAIAAWFDAAMDRVSGNYKRKAQLWSFAIALAVSVGLNISAIRVGLALWDQPALSKAVAALKVPQADEAVQILEEANLPIGWLPAGVSGAQPLRDDIVPLAPTYGFGWWITSILGWLITAGATLFGAPFWFDTLQRFVRLKGSGPSPAEKRDGTGAAA